jgi:two-component system chemotaxis response regulator CheY
MLKILIADDDMISRKFLSSFLSQYGECDNVIDGMEAIDAFMFTFYFQEFCDGGRYASYQFTKLNS